MSKLDLNRREFLKLAAGAGAASGHANVSLRCCLLSK